MEDIQEQDYINESNEIIDAVQLKKITQPEIQQSICKIYRKVNNSKTISGTGFFCSVPTKNIKLFITNNHVLDQDFLDNEKKLVYFIYDDQKEIKREINLEISRYKFTDVDLDYTVIEILKRDNILYFLKVDKLINSEDYKDQQVFSYEFPGGKNLKYSHGTILKKKDNKFFYSLGTFGGASGSPIILVNNLKVIGLHKAAYKKNSTIKLGIPINIIVNKIPFNKPNDLSLKEENEKVNFISGCPAFGCSNSRQIFKWKHNCGGEEWIDINGFLECKECGSKCLLINSLFKCDGHSEAREVNKEKICEILSISSSLEEGSKKFKIGILKAISNMIFSDDSDEDEHIDKNEDDNNDDEYICYA